MSEELEKYDENINNDNNEKKEHILIYDLSLMPNIDVCYGYWQAYLFNFETEQYEPINNEFIFYKGKFFDDLSSKPWTDEDVENVRLMANYFNDKGAPVCVFRHERDL